MSEIERLATDLTYEAAVTLDERIDTWHEQGHKLAIAAYKGRIWLQLGHASWEAYCETKRAAFAPGLGREERREVVGEMRDAGMSTRAIGTALGVGQRTVVRDLRGESFDSPAERVPVVGLDGKSYTQNPARDTTPPAPRIDPFAPLVEGEPLTEEEVAAIAESKAQLAAAEPERDLARRQRVATDLLDRHVYNLSLIGESAEAANYTPAMSPHPITAEMLDGAEKALRYIRKVFTEKGLI